MVAILEMFNVKISFKSPSLLLCPPNIIAVPFTSRNENSLHGGGVLPVVTGDDHTPKDINI